MSIYSDDWCSTCVDYRPVTVCSTGQGWQFYCKACGSMTDQVFRDDYDDDYGPDEIEDFDVPGSNFNQLG